MNNTAKRNDMNMSITTVIGSEVGMGALDSMQQKLSLAGIELQHMENEGGPPLNDRQAAKAHGYLNSSRRIRKITLSYEALI